MSSQYPDSKEIKPPKFRPSRRERRVNRIMAVAVYFCTALIFWIIWQDVALSGWRWITITLCISNVAFILCVALFIRLYRRH